MGARFERDVERSSRGIRRGRSERGQRLGLGMWASAGPGQTARNYLVVFDDDRGHGGVGPGLGNPAPRQPRCRG